ncbi:hypothetical protein GPJ56_006661 [Histomonas meleagridis]|uniref:uncharacterized protein n=1 Tax=Histomonas meleagridis TaxID=135588 RepID=UPI003559421B|nr:hypothetical protein GPJ56_006661 [Histomonas meleagridis]KAH0803672.1 hypothetical protein GO595_003556 [Histomonas meleagridis]
MPPRKAKQSEKLEKEANEMESIMAMLREQIDEERAKVQPKSGTRWAAAAEGPIGKIDTKGAFAKKLLSKKKTPPTQSPKKSPKKSMIPVRRIPKENHPQQPPEQPRKIEIVVEPQGGKLWGNVMVDSEIQPDNTTNQGGSLWGPHPDEKEEAKQFQEELKRIRSDEQTKNNEEEEEIPPNGSGGALWGPHPDEKEETKQFQEELKRIRSDEQTKNNEEEEENPPIGSGGALWGPHPDEEAENLEFQKEIARIRGVKNPPPKSQSVTANIVTTKHLNPTSFTYFDLLMNRDILTDETQLKKRDK